MDDREREIHAARAQGVRRILSRWGVEVRPDVWAEVEAVADDRGTLETVAGLYLYRLAAHIEASTTHVYQSELERGASR